jgi:hypothetical protein
VRTTTPPPTVDSRTATLPPATDAGAQGVVGDIRVSASPRVIDVDSISVVPGGVDEDLVRDQAQID